VAPILRQPPAIRESLSGGVVAEGDIPPEVQRFIAETIDAADQLDILLLLYRNPERAFTALEVSQAVFTVASSATLRLEALVARGLLTSSGTADPAYRYQPATEELARRADQLAAVYQANRVGVIQLLFARPPDPLQTFADAFRFKGKGG
jgi:hypothetical protein